MRAGLLAGAACGLVGLFGLLIGLPAGLLIGLLALLAGALGAWLLDRLDPALSWRRGRVRAAAIGGAVSTLLLGLILSIMVILLVASGEIETQIAGLLQQFGLSPADAPTLQVLLLGCAVGLYIVVVPVVGGGLGALAGLAYSFLRPTLATAKRIR